MSADPEPEEVLILLDGKGAMAKAHSGRPETVDLLEMYGRMPRILLHQRKNGMGQLLNTGR